MHIWQKIRALDNGDNPFLEVLKEKIKRITVEKDFVPIGNTMPDFSGMDVFLDCRDGFRCSIIAPTGSGKTTLISIILFQFYINGILPVILFDVKNEYRKKLFEAARFFGSEHVLENGIIELCPYYIYKANPELRGRLTNKTLFQFNSNNITWSDLHTMLGIVKDENIMMRIAIDTVVKRLRPEQRDIITLYKIFWKKDVFKVMTGGNISEQTRMSIVSRLADILDKSILGKRTFPIEENILLGNILDFCFLGYDTIPREYTQTYLAILERMIRKLLTEKTKMRIVSVVDESRLVVPKRENPSCKQEVMTSVRITRYAGEYMIFAAQDINDIDPTIISQSKYVFISPITNKSTISMLLKDLNVPEEVKAFTEDELIPMMLVKYRKKKVRPWLMIEKTGKITPFYPYFRG
jgi:hypothetical protein